MPSDYDLGLAPAHEPSQSGPSSPPVKGKGKGKANRSDDEVIEISSGDEDYKPRKAAGRPARKPRRSSRSTQKVAYDVDSDDSIDDFIVEGKVLSPFLGVGPILTMLRIIDGESEAEKDRIRDSKKKKDAKRSKGKGKGKSRMRIDSDDEEFEGSEAEEVNDASDDDEPMVKAEKYDYLAELGVTEWTRKPSSVSIQALGSKGVLLSSNPLQMAKFLPSTKMQVRCR